MAAKMTKDTASAGSEFVWPYGQKNYIWFAISMVVIIVGYFLLAQGSMTLAPALLVGGYCVLIPISLLIKGKEEPNEAAEAVEGQASD
jgi:hypothetical protein